MCKMLVESVNKCKIDGSGEKMERSNEMWFATNNG